MVDGFRGVAGRDDVRFKNKEDALLKSTKYPSNFDERVDTSKVNLQVMRPWIAEKVEAILGFEDEVLVEFVSDHLESEQFPDPRKMQISLTGFLEKRARPFMAELWSLLLSAQDSVAGIPRAFVEQKKREMQQARAETDHVMSEVRRRGAAGTAPHDAHAPPTARFDRGRSPIAADRRRDAQRPPDSFVDKRGNVTRRERDAGWRRTDASDERDQYDERDRYDRRDRYHDRRNDRDDDYRGARRRSASPDGTPPYSRRN
ncbi:hypothetical protein CBS9595_002634 [Malassezia furfur]|nr:hypothetical protein CBS9595_002634 [Malassezia furfur]